MTWLSDRAVRHLRETLDRPDVSGTRYELVEELGRGGMGRVYRARDRELGRDVAFKVPADAAAPEELVRRLLAEARILARLEHPGIVPVHDVGRLADGRVYYTMKLVRGERLDRYVRAHRDPAERLRVFERVCEAVAFAHSHGVLHRDLKPENVMIGAYGEVLVLDWGVAKLLAGAATETGVAARDPGIGSRETGDAPGESGTAAALSPPPGVTDPGTVLGTPGYMAPEQATGEPQAVDARADVYGLGALLFFLLADAPPPATPGGAPPSPRRADPRVPRPLDAICRRALAPDPRERYPGAEELAAEVSRYLTGRRVAAHREGTLERAGRILSRHRAVVLLVLAYLLMRVAFLVVGGL